MTTSLEFLLLPSEAVEATMDALCELKRSGIGLAVAIGGTLAESVYGGDLTRLRARLKGCPGLCVRGASAAAIQPDDAASSDRGV